MDEYIDINQSNSIIQNPAEVPERGFDVNLLLNKELLTVYQQELAPDFL
jgi:hypothetical protein